MIFLHISNVKLDESEEAVIGNRAESNTFDTKS